MSVGRPGHMAVLVNRMMKDPLVFCANLGEVWTRFTLPLHWYFVYTPYLKKACQMGKVV